MSDSIKHECGIAFIRLLKPLEFYVEKYGTAHYGLNKLYLLMEKQHNRGHDGAGIANIKLDVKPGNKYISIEKSNSDSPIKDIFKVVTSEIEAAGKATTPERARDPQWLKNNVRFSGEVFLGHLRYGTYGRNSLGYCHPLLRESNWMSRSLLVAGNFNLTNTDELFQLLVDIGQHPKNKSDTVTILEKIGHFLDCHHAALEQKYLNEGKTRREASALIARNIDIQRILRDACRKWDGGYVVAGLIGHGDSFIIRDPAGIRPAFYYQDDEVVVAASERPVIQTAFNVPFDSIKELPPAQALIVRKDGAISLAQFTEPMPKKACSFERIYFSRGTDAEIYQERKALGKHLTRKILEKINDDLEHTVFSFIPNTAETCYMGMVQELGNHCNRSRAKRLMDLKGKDFTQEEVEEILSFRPRTEKVAVKDVKLRTFITEDSQRNDLVAHVYDITYGTLKKGVDTLVVIDDSIVRGTTMKESILRILDRLGPKRIVLASSAPQIRYPDCYGIDMAKLGDFVAFRAAIELLKETHQTHIIDEVYKRCKESVNANDRNMPNHVKAIYKPFEADVVSAKISQLLSPVGIHAEVVILFQTIEGLRESCPNHSGDWYFTGNYPTPGGNKVCNKSFINFVEGRNERAY
jgi:amidophosphoribosyltransferase